MTYRTGLLLGSAFLAGIAIGPTVGPTFDSAFGSGSSMLAHQLGITPASAEEAGESRADTYKLLTLFGDVFERVRADYVEKVSDRDLIENALNGMLTGLDPHSSYMNAKQWRDMQVQTNGEFGGLGLEVTEDNGLIKVVSPIDDTPAARAGLKAGDLITSIDGRTVEGISLNDAVDKMRGPANSSIKLTVKRQGIDKPIEVSLTREVIRPPVVKSRLDDGNIAYLRVSSFNEQTDATLRAALTKLRQQANGHLAGIVLDLRNNPGGLLDQAVAVANDFLNQGEIVSTRARHKQDSQRWDAKSGGDISDGTPMVVLINGGSASASEIVAGALQDHRRAVLVGTRSFGKGSVQTVIPLPGNGAMRLTTARYYTPSGRSIQGLGITPDVQVASSRVEVAHFGPEREADLNHILSNQGGAPQAAPPARTDLPPVAQTISKLPPENWPTFDATKPATDYQLTKGEVVLKAMAAQKRAQR